MHSTSMMTDFPYLYRGIVIDNKDPLNLGRCRIKIPSLYGNTTLEPNDLPWARGIEMISSNSKRGSSVVPDIGDVVWVLFEGGDDESPVFFGGTRGAGEFAANPDIAVLYQEEDDTLFYDRKSHAFTIKSGDNLIVINKERNEVQIQSAHNVNIIGATTVNIYSDNQVSVQSPMIDLTGSTIKLSADDLVVLGNNSTYIDYFKYNISEAERSAQIAARAASVTSDHTTLDDPNIEVPTEYVGGEYIWPITHQPQKITSAFGPRDYPPDPYHTGIDIAGSGIYGADILAANSGIVTKSKTSNSGYGKRIVINHGDGKTTLYGHCSELLVSAGDEVKQGDVIARVGSTGLSTGPHLHFETRENGTAVDPMTYFK